VLQAADILLYDADIVPVGKDQKQHLEVARDIAVKINEAYGEVLKLPEPEIAEEVATIPGLDGQKMSKSYGNTIELFMDEKALRKRVMGIVTDSTPLEAPKDPEGSTIVGAVPAWSPTAARSPRMEDDPVRAGGVGYGEFKKRLFEAIWDRGTSRPMREPPPEDLRCEKCGGSVFRSFHSSIGDEAADDFRDSTERDLNPDDAEGDALPGDVMDLNRL
jgi:tryptophanyl-tRNA synthetase